MSKKIVSLKVNGKALARAVLTSLQQVNCTELVTLSLNELKNTDYLVDSNIAKILCTTPKLRALRLQYSAGALSYLPHLCLALSLSCSHPMHMFCLRDSLKLN